MKIVIIGIGDIAKKAYLPVLSTREDVELVLCTRNEETLKEVSRKYKIEKTYTSIDELIENEKDLDGALVSTHTIAHFKIAKKLIENKINVYIDKPLSYYYEEADEIVKLAKENNVVAMVGFNRRFAPRVKELKEKGKADIIVIQKNRGHEAADIRDFVVQDYVHVVDTLRFLSGEEVIDMDINFKGTPESLENVVVTLKTKNTTAIGIMNRVSGITEENIDYMVKGKKYIVEELVDLLELTTESKSKITFGPWETTLEKRGFYNIIDEFITSIREGREPNPSLEDSKITHEICEKIVNYIEKNQ